MGGQGIPKSSLVVVVVLDSILEASMAIDAQKLRTMTITTSWTIGAILDTHDRGDGRGAGAALVFCSAGNKDGRIVGDRGNHGSERSPGVSLVIDIGIGQHRGTPTSNSAVGTGIRFGKYAGDPLERPLPRGLRRIPGRRSPRRREPRRHRSYP